VNKTLTWGNVRKLNLKMCKNEVVKWNGDQGVATLALGSRARQGFARVQTKKEAPGVTSYAPGNGEECEGMNTHIPILGVGVSMDSRILRERFQRSKPIGLKSYLYHWKYLGT
jgi:hypothetical protein